MGLRRKFRRRLEDEPVTRDEMEDFARNVMAPDKGMTEEEAAQMDATVEHIALDAVRAELGVDADDPRSFEELVEEVKRRAGVSD